MPLRGNAPTALTVGYTVVRQMARGRVQEVRTPGGFAKALKTIALEGGAHGASDAAEYRRLSAIRHPYLSAIDALEIDGGTLRLLTDWADSCLQEEFAGARSKGLPGVPRERLLAVLAEVAEALDFFHLRGGAPHLGVEPDRILLVAGHAKLSEPRPARRRRSAATPWTAPEALAGNAGPASDQFALAAVYAALLGGTPPYEPVALANAAAGRRVVPPRFDGVPAADQEALRAALSLDPLRRYASCTAFVAALSGGEESLVPREDPRLSALKPRSRLRHSTATSPAAYAAPLGRPEFRARAQAFAAAAGWTFAERSPWCLVLACHGGERGFRPMLGLHDPFLVHLEHAGRQTRGGWLVSASVEHLGDRLPDELFQLHSRVLLRRIVAELTLTEAPGAGMRRHARRRYSGRAVLEPRSGPFAGLRVPCQGFDLAARGVGLLSGFDVPLGPAVLELEGVGLGFRGRIVRAWKQEDGQVRLGIAFAEDLPRSDARLIVDQPTARNPCATQVVGGGKGTVPAPPQRVP